MRMKTSARGDKIFTDAVIRYVTKRNREGSVVAVEPCGMVQKAVRHALSALSVPLSYPMLRFVRPYGCGRLFCTGRENS